MRLTILMILLIASLQAVHAGIVTEERYLYYDVSGNSAVELRAAINRKRLSLGKRSDALTSWRISWQVGLAKRLHRCTITDVTITADIEYLLPRWPEVEAHPDKNLQAHWQRYFEQLNAHELHHGALVKAATLNIERAIHRSDDTTEAPRRCDALEELANKNARQAVSAMEEKQRRFDKKTNHGRSTGATFP